MSRIPPSPDELLELLTQNNLIGNRLRRPRPTDGNLNGRRNPENPKTKIKNKIAKKSRWKNRR